MKRKKKNWDNVPWTSFQEIEPSSQIPERARPHHIFMNSIYQVSVWFEKSETYGEIAHLSFKTHDKQPRHDWRERNETTMKLKTEELPDYGDHMTIEAFVQSCQNGSFIDYDGHGNYATKDAMFDKIVYPSDVAKPGFKPRSEFTHVIWFNR